MDKSPTVQEEGKRTGENRELNETERTTSNNDNQVNGLLSRCGQVTRGRGIRDPGCRSGVCSDDFLGAVCVNLEISEVSSVCKYLRWRVDRIRSCLGPGDGGSRKPPAWSESRWKQ
ncbi:hypothetical protein AMECASPLE_025583 [Ameca splendens]|uniref:Uncharacterized protein n=1 Tax=Ameca splendens TaxID=208324 RepID=A0ABV1AB23_9TELE